MWPMQAGYCKGANVWCTCGVQDKHSWCIRYLWCARFFSWCAWGVLQERIIYMPQETVLTLLLTVLTLHHRVRLQHARNGHQMHPCPTHAGQILSTEVMCTIFYPYVATEHMHFLGLCKPKQLSKRPESTQPNSSRGVQRSSPSRKHGHTIHHTLALLNTQPHLE